MKDPYEILGVSKSAPQEDIKNAYRSLAKKFHPDLNPGNKKAEERFKEIAEAYERVGTTEERAKFDRGETPEQQQEQAERYARQQSRASRPGGPFYHETQSGGGGRYSYSFGQDFGGDEFFENLFRSAGQRGRGRSETADLPGEDHYYQMSVDFKDAALGAQREITLPTGKRLQVKIPAGVETGTKLRFKNQGAPGVGKAPPGDAYVEITVTPVAGFKRVNADIETEVPISFIEAIEGAEINIPTIDGVVQLKVPAGVTTGSRLRIRGKGIQLPKGPGNQIVVLKVVMPKSVSPQLHEAVKNWNGRFNYNPREE